MPKQINLQKEVFEKIIEDSGIWWVRYADHEKQQREKVGAHTTVNQRRSKKTKEISRGKKRKKVSGSL